jgi:hypothetical protein
MKKLILIIALTFLLTLVGSTAQSFEPVFCNDYEFTCCAAFESADFSRTKTQAQALKCGSSNLRCEISNIESIERRTGDDLRQQFGYYVGSGNCGVKNPWYTSPFYQCSNERKLTARSVQLKPGELIYFGYRGLGTESMSYRIELIKEKLIFTGASGSNNGVAVPGADSCTFRPSGNTIYTSTNRLAGKRSVTSYTVPSQPPANCVLSFQQGNRHICGYEEESCQLDNECGGHTFGNKECNARTLQTYGCRNYGTPTSGGDRAPSTSGWGTDASRPTRSGDADFGKRCEITSAKRVQCCGDNDCGTGAFCDVDPNSATAFTCQQEVECRQDADCGVSEQCDAFSNEIKTAECRNGQCVRDSEKVECCADFNCAEGEFCSLDNQCERSAAVKQACTDECCINEPGFIDKPCPSDQNVCCPNQECAVDSSQCSGGSTAASEGAAELSCAEKGGVFKKAVDKSFLQNLIGNEDIPERCLIPNLFFTIFGVVVALIGTAIIIWGGMPVLGGILIAVGVLISLAAQFRPF